MPALRHEHGRAPVPLRKRPSNRQGRTLGHRPEPPLGQAGFFVAKRGGLPTLAAWINPAAAFLIDGLTLSTQTDHKTFSSAVIRSPRQTKRRCGLCSVHLGYTGLFLIEYFLLRSFTENAKAGGKRSRKRI